MTSEKHLPRWVLWAFLLLGGYIVLLSLDVLPYMSRTSKRGLFETPHHWQITSLGVAFACAGLSMLVLKRGRLLRVLVGAVFLTSFLAPMGWFVYFSGVLSLPQQMLASIPLLLGGAGALFGLVRTAQGKSSVVALADDPVQDAEVLLAYGRKAQAQAVLRRAMQRHPARAAQLQQRLDEIGRGN